MKLTFILLLLSSLYVATLSQDFYKEKYEKFFRYAAFGTSRTWGVGLDPETESYIKLLSKTNSINYAIRASDPSYPAMCTQTIVGNEIFDVIIIEYERRYLLGLRILVKRLRNRFPKALIILTDFFQMNQVGVKVKKENNEYRETSLSIWLQEHNITLNNQETYDFLAQQDDSRVDYTLNPEIYERGSYFQELKNEFNVSLLAWDHRGGTMKELILRYLPFYQQDWVHWSKLGHQLIADTIKIIMVRETVASSSGTATVGSWGKGDFCASWFNNGLIPNATSIVNQISAPAIRRLNERVSIALEFNKMKHLYALEFFDLSGQEEEEVVLEIMNPLNEERVLSICFMATGPDSSIYPKVEFTLESFLNIQQMQKKVKIINPIETSYNYPVHVQQTSSLGLIPQGPSLVRMKKILQHNEIKKEPFRLVGFSISDGEIFPSILYSFEEPLR